MTCFTRKSVLIATNDTQNENFLQFCFNEKKLSLRKSNTGLAKWIILQYEFTNARRSYSRRITPSSWQHIFLAQLCHIRKSSILQKFLDWISAITTRHRSGKTTKKKKTTTAFREFTLYVCVCAKFSSTKWYT